MLNRRSTLVMALIILVSSTTCHPTAKAIEKPKSFNFKNNVLVAMDEKIKEIKDERERIKQEEIQRELKRQQDEEQQRINELNKHRRRILFTITYYTDSPEEGGCRDKKGIPLSNHGYPVVAMPKDVPYGCRIEFDNEVLGSTEFINVDSGNAIKWLSDDECVVDVFVENASQSCLNRLGKHKCYGWLYELGY